MAGAFRTSVALATCDGERFLEAQLDSLCAQTVQPFELVVSDDASRDRTPDILAAFARSAPFPVHVRKNSRRRGYKSNFVAVAAACTGDLIAFCDQDDVWEPHKLERMAAPFEDPQVLLAHHDATLIDAEGRAIGALRTPVRGPWDVVPGFAQVFRRRLADFSPLQPLSVDHLWAIAAAKHPSRPADQAARALAHDQFYLFWADVVGRTAHVPEALVRYRQHPGALFGRAPHPVLFAFAKAPELAAGRAAAAAGQIALLEAAGQMCSGAEAERLAEALHRLRSLQPLLQARAELYEAGIGERIRRIGELLGSGGYWRGGVSPDLLDLLTDVCVGIPLGLVKGRRGRAAPSTRSA